MGKKREKMPIVRLAELRGVEVGTLKLKLLKVDGATVIYRKNNVNPDYCELIVSGVIDSVFEVEVEPFVVSLSRNSFSSLGGVKIKNFPEKEDKRFSTAVNDDHLDDKGKLIKRTFKEKQ